VKLILTVNFGQRPLAFLKFPVYFTMMSENLQVIRVLKHYLPNSSASKLILITGARQTGKTTLAKNRYPHFATSTWTHPKTGNLSGKYQQRHGLET
jgi:hypothetical protein